MAAKSRDVNIATVKAPNLVRTVIHIRGTAPFVMNRFAKKGEMMKDMATPKAEKKSRRDRPPRDFDGDFRGALHKAEDGWYGIPCSGIRTALVDACRTVGLVMTNAKMAVFVIPDGFDVADGVGLTRIIGGEPERHEMRTRNDDGSTDIRVRGMWRHWEADVTLEFDADMISAESVANLLNRVGRQVGLGEGRHFSKKSCGQGWGTFELVNQEASSAAA